MSVNELYKIVSSRHQLLCLLSEDKYYLIDEIVKLVKNKEKPLEKMNRL